ncbi:MAG: carboxypeptidase-like regulatory domain-containing protein [Saprospiraceae bacterium]|nr:carboxypeptidase-like regulatory domain-containing protein [Saprospiraceae bacterium]
MRTRQTLQGILTLFLIIAFQRGPHAQALLDTSDVVQLSGIVWTDENGGFEVLPYVNIYVQSTQRGTFSSNEGFFSLVARKGEVVVFSSIGYKDVEYTVPDTLKGTRYSVFQLMTRDTFLLPETVIYPWPSREHFKLEFLAMDVESELESLANENLSDRALAQLIAYLPTDGDENVDFFLRQQAQAYYYEGQIRPMNVLNVFAWKQFIEALKRGDFKKKKK